MKKLSEPILSDIISIDWRHYPICFDGNVSFFVCAVNVMTGQQVYKDMTQFWGKLFGINFAMGVATGLTLEFQFGTNWAYYSHYVGDIFGVPLSKQEKRENRQISSQRALNENVIGMIKRFKIIADRYRNRRKRFALRFNLIGVDPTVVSPAAISVKAGRAYSASISYQFCR